MKITIMFNLVKDETSVTIENDENEKRQLRFNISNLDSVISHLQDELCDALNEAYLEDGPED